VELGFCDVCEQTILALRERFDRMFHAVSISFIHSFRSPEEIRLQKSMIRVMNFSVVFFTRRYLTSTKMGAGSGQFSHSYDHKPDQILSPLVDAGLLIGGNFIKNARAGNDELPYSSFCKQLPAVIRQNPRIQQAFDVSIILQLFSPKDARSLS
jgi:hypothetical protein